MKRTISRTDAIFYFTYNVVFKLPLESSTTLISKLLEDGYTKEEIEVILSEAKKECLTICNR